jgi:hypothetical protein
MRKVLEENIYTNSDINLSATLCALDFPLMFLNRDNPKRIEFVFHNSPELRRAVDDYWSGDLKLNPQKVLAKLRFLKNRMYNQL